MVKLWRLASISTEHRHKAHIEESMNKVPRYFISQLVPFRLVYPHQSRYKNYQHQVGKSSIQVKVTSGYISF